MVRVEDFVRALGEHARLAAPGPDFSGVQPWERPGAHAPEVMLLAVGVPGETVLAEPCAGALARDPGRDIAASWEVHAQEAGKSLVLLDGELPWATVLQIAAELEAARSGQPRRPPDEAGGRVQPGDLFALAEAFADLVGGPIIIEDANFRVLSYSSFTGSMDRGRDTAILGRRMPAEWVEFLESAGDLERLRTSTDVLDLPSGPWHAHRRLITAVRSPTQLLGILWVAEGDQPLPEDAPAALRKAADIAAPHLARHLEGHRAERTWRGQLVRSLLEGRGQLHRHADELGLPRDGSLTVLAFAPQSEEVPSEDIWDRITDHVALACEAFRWHSAVARVGRVVFAVLATADGSSRDGPERLGRDIVTRSVPVLRGPLCGAAGSSGTGLGGLPRRRIEAEDALGIVRTGGGDGRFATYDAVRSEVVLREIREVLAQREELRLPGLQALLDEDAHRGSHLAATLREYLRCGAQAPVAAQKLGVHVTTLRYRLGRIRDITELDITDPATRLVCELLLGLEPR